MTQSLGKSQRPTQFVLFSILIVFVFAVLMAVTAMEKTVYTSIIVSVIMIFGVSIALCLYDVQPDIPSVQATHAQFYSLLGFKRCTLLCWSNFSLGLIVSHITLALLFFLIFISGIVAAVVRYGSFIRGDPWSFLTEIGATAVFPAIPIVLVAWNRGFETKVLLLTLCLVSSALGGLHMLLELSGFYASQFDQKETLTLVMQYEDLHNDTAMLLLIDDQILLPFSQPTTYDYCFIIPLFGLVFSCVCVVVAQIRRRFCRDPNVPRPELKLANYAALGLRMWILLLLNLFLIIVLGSALSQGLRDMQDWEVNGKKTSDGWGFLVQLVVVVCFVIIGAAVSIVALTTRFVGFIKTSPWLFMGEVTILCLLIVAPWGLISYNRGQDHADILQLVIFSCALAGGHTLLELSATYATIFNALYRKDDIQLIERRSMTHRRSMRNEVEDVRWRFLPSKLDYCVQLSLKNRVYIVLSLIILLCLAFFVFVVSRETQTEKTIFIAILLLAISLVCAFVMTDLRLEYLEPTDTRKRCCNDLGFKECKCCCIQEFSFHLFVSIVLVFALAGFLVLSGGIAVYVRYGWFVRSEFWLFMVEVAMMSLLTTIPVALISWNRGGQSKDLFVESILISSKFGALHIVLEISGVYQVYYEGKERFGIVSKAWMESNSTQILQFVITQMNERSQSAAHNETAFLVVVAMFFGLSAVGVIMVFLRRACCRDPHKDRSEEKLRDYEALGNRMKALLVLSVVLCSLLVPILVLGLREQDSWSECCLNLCYYWSEIALGAILAAVVCSFIVASFAACSTRFGGFINLSPWSFFGELVVVMVLSMAPLGFLSYNRGHPHDAVLEELGVFALKFGGLHLLLELAGFYTTALGGKYRRDLIAPLPRDRTAFSDPLELVSQSRSASQNDDLESISRRSVDMLVDEIKR